MQQSAKFDIAVVGGGITGLAAACLASRSGLRTCVIDASKVTTPDTGWQPGTPNPRVSAFNIASVNLLEHIGVWNSIVERDACPYRTMSVWDQSSQAKIHFDVSQLADQPSANLENLGYIVENSLVTWSMLDRLQQNYNVQLLYGHSVNEVANTRDGVLLGLAESRDEIFANLVIAADGARSVLRSLSGIDLQSDSFNQIALVAEVNCEFSHQHTAWQCFTPEGPVALLPRGEKVCSLVWSVDVPKARQLQQASTEEFSSRLYDAFGDKLGTLTVTGKVNGFPLYNRHASRYIAPHMALIGDAAHTIHPLAGLGANIGLLDAASLMDVVQQASGKGRSLGGQSTLRRYERWRKGENLAVLELMNLFKQGFGTTDTLLTNIRQSAFSIADRPSPLKNSIIAYAMGLAGDLPASCRSTSL